MHQSMILFQGVLLKPVFADGVLHPVLVSHERAGRSKKHHRLHVVLLSVSQRQPPQPQFGPSQQQPEQHRHRSASHGVIVYKRLCLCNLDFCLMLLCLLPWQGTIWGTFVSTTPTFWTTPSGLVENTSGSSSSPPTW